MELNSYEVKVQCGVSGRIYSADVDAVSAVAAIKQAIEWGMARKIIVRYQGCTEAMVDGAEWTCYRERWLPTEILPYI